MLPASAPPAGLMHRLRFQDAERVTTTQIATIWRAQRPDGSTVAIKQFHKGAPGTEAPGLELLAAWDGGPAVRLLTYDQAAGAAVMEWLPGPSLGDLSRSGRDREATEHLATVALNLHRRPIDAPKDLPRLTDWFSDLLSLRPPRAWAQDDRRNLYLARGLAREMLATERAGRPLHGDLHQDNVRKGARGYTALDPKGLWAEPAYELANAFRNPNGFATDAPEVIRYRARRWSARLGVDQERLLAWAVAKAGLSIAWQLKHTPVPDLVETRLLAALQAAYHTERLELGWRSYGL